MRQTYPRLLATAALCLALCSPAAVLAQTGCADGQREGFTDAATFPDIAGCGGGWTVPGVSSFAPLQVPACPGMVPEDSRSPACSRGAGDDGRNPEGTDCNASDLCAAGWHVCFDAEDVDAMSPTGCVGATQPDDLPLLFLTRQSSTGCGECAAGTSVGPECTSGSCAAGCFQTENTSNDVFGCGNYGATPRSSCGVLDRFSHDHCHDIEEQGWSCQSPNGFCEQFNVTHWAPTTGGVLCCRGAYEDANNDGILD